MARGSIIKANFTAGEISPRLLARVDVSKYHNGAREITNGYPLVHGGCRRRAGLRYRAGAKNNDKPARVISFIFSRTQAFILELGELYIRFYSGTGQVLDVGVPVEVTTPWDDAELRDLKYCQGADTMFFAHSGYEMRKLVRYSDTVWKLSKAKFDVPPSDEIGERPTTALTLSAATVGAGRTFTAAADAFRLSDVGRYIESAAGRGLVTAFTDTLNVTVTIEDAFAGVNVASGAWKITESPKSALTPSVAGPVGVAVTLTAAASSWKAFAQNTHVGNYVEINGGLVEITGVTSDLIVAGIVRTVLAGVTAVPSGAWALRQVVWNAVDGYPRAVTLFEQRLVPAGSPAYPNTVWGSKTGEFYDFSEGVADSDAFSFALASEQVNPIEHLASTRVLLPFSFGGEFSMTGGVEKPLTPTNVQARQQTVYGCAVARPVRVADEIIFVQRGGRKIRALGYRAETDGFNAPDISILSEHITEGGILDMAYQQDPDQVIWMVRGDGYAVTCSIDRDQDAVGFAKSNSDGTFESFATMPYNDTVQAWAVVKRTVGGATKRYIEQFEEGLNTDSAVTGAVAENVVTSAVWAAGVVTVTRAGHGYATGNTIRLSGFTPSGYNGEYTITVTGANTYTFALTADPGATTVVGTDAKATANWAGFTHLNGKSVQVVADGYYGGAYTVAAGAIVLNRAAYAIEGGLPYVTTIKTLPPEFPTGQGTAQGNAISIHEIIVRFHKTIGGKINGKPIDVRKFGSTALDQPLTPLTGDIPVEQLGWGKTGRGDSDGSITLVQDLPFNFQVLGVITRLTVNDG